MKKPENFNTGATRKTDPLAEAIKNNFSTEEKFSEMKVNSVIMSETPTEKIISQSQSQKQLEEKGKKEKFLVSMEKGERASYKAFCALKGISMNHFIICAVDYFREDIEEGKVIINQHSYKRK